MLTRNSRICVTSRTFVKSKELRNLLEKEFDNITYNEEGIHFDEEGLIAFLEQCDGAIVSEDKISKLVIDRLPNLKIISKYGVGLDSIDLEYLKKKQVKLAWKSGINAYSVAELALSYLILMLRESSVLNNKLIEGKWEKAINGRDLSESTIGILGFGQIGRKLASFLEPHGSEIFTYDPFITDKTSLPNNVNFLDFDSLLEKVDALSVHVPLSDETRGLIDFQQINLMKENSVLINLSRGGVVNEEAVLRALKAGHLAGAAFDVFENEPGFNKELVSLNNFFSTPHIAGTSRSSSLKLGLSSIQGLVENKH